MQSSTRLRFFTKYHTVKFQPSTRLILPYHFSLSSCPSFTAPPSPNYLYKPQSSPFLFPFFNPPTHHPTTTPSVRLSRLSSFSTFSPSVYHLRSSAPRLLRSRHSLRSHDPTTLDSSIPRVLDSSLRRFPRNRMSAGCFSRGWLSQHAPRQKSGRLIQVIFSLTRSLLSD
jgi:hypothetical protein